MRQRLSVTILFLSIVCVRLQAQATEIIDGEILSAHDNKPIANVLVKAIKPYSGERAIIAYTLTDRDGKYSLRMNTKLKVIELELSLIGYDKECIRLNAATQTVNRYMIASLFSLKEVVVRYPAISNKGDTVNYDAAAFISKRDHNLEDLLKKLPGITVQTNGKIEYQGKPISKFYIEDMDMLGGKYNLATQNIAAETITSVQIYENHQPVRLLRDIRFSDKAAINIKLKNNTMSRPVGNVLLGGGYSGKWLFRGEVFGFMANKEMQMLLSTKADNRTGVIKRELENHLLYNKTKVKAGTLISPISVQAPYPISEKSGFHENIISSVNTIKKIATCSSVKINAAYQKENTENEKKVSNSYFTGGKKILNEEDICSEISAEKLDASVNYLINKENLYVNNDFGGNVNFSRSYVDSHSSIIHHQKCETKEFDFTNQLDLTWKKAGSIYSIHSYITGGNIPGNRLAVVSSGRNDSITQTVSGFSFQTKHASSFAKRLGDNSGLMFGLALETEHDNIKTNLVNEMPDTSFKNRCSGYKITTSVSPTYNYSKDKFQLAVSGPFHYYRFKFKSNSLSSFTKPVFSFRISSGYRINPGLTATFSGSIVNRFGDILNFIEMPVRRSYLSILSRNSGILMQNKQARITTGYDYRNTMNGLFSSLQCSYSKTKHNALKGSDISETGETSAFIEERKTFSNNIMANFYLAKNFHDIKTVASITANVLSSESERRRQNSYLNYSNRIYKIAPSINFNTLDWLSIRAGGSFEYIYQKVMNQRKDIILPEGEIELSVLPFQNVEIYGRIDYLNVSDQEHKSESSFWADCGIRCQVAKKAELNLALYNLTDQRSCTKTMYRELDKVQTIYSIRPRGCMLSFKVNY